MYIKNIKQKLYVTYILQNQDGFSKRHALDPHVNPLVLAIVFVDEKENLKIDKKKKFVDDCHPHHIYLNPKLCTSPVLTSTVLI